MFQEQYSRTQEYCTDTTRDDSTTISVSTVYKLVHGDKLDARIVTANVSNGDVTCTCRYWETMGLLCRHCLLVMFVHGSGGHSVFQHLDDRYIKKRWTRSARAGYVTITASVPRSVSQREEERYVMLYAKFGAVIRIMYKEEVLGRLLELHADMMVAAANRSVDELADLLQQGLTLTVPAVPVPEVQGCTPDVTRMPEIAVKFPKAPKPSKNTPRFKVGHEIRRSKEKNKCKRAAEREAALHAPIDIQGETI
ncbi:hypothetical protein LINPERPRIM_LOCUS9498 [Linum perenne]